MIKLKHIIFLLTVLFITNSCSKEPEILNLKEYVSYFMGEIYYWNEQAPKPSPKDFDDIFKFYNASLVPQDRWSWMETGADYLKQETGVYTSYGCSLRQNVEYYGDYSVNIAFVYPNSPFDKAGITRGWTILKINGKDTHELIKGKTFDSEFNINTNVFTLRDLQGKIKDVTISKSTISTHSILISEIYTDKDFSALTAPVGYINYLTFNANMMDDIKTAVAKMKAANVKKLILDLRYNGGGDSRPTSLLANMLASKACDGQVLVRRKHNAKYSSRDSDIKIQRTGESLDLDRLYIISGSGTASASEVIINGLKPMMDVVMVGDTTYGKPNGMYLQAYPKGDYEHPDYIFLPICFYNVNKNGEGDFNNGLIPNNYRPDDLYHNWGPQEDLIKSCLTHIATGNFPSLPQKPKVKTSSKNYVLQTEEDSANYGRYVVVP